MRLVIAVAIVCAVTVARAQPSLTSPTPEPPPSTEDDRAVVGVHVGIAASYFDGYTNPAAGSGPSVEVELGWRHRWLSVIGYGDFTNASTPSDPRPPEDIHTRFLGTGGRVCFHFFGAFIGSGIGIESVHQSGPGNAMLDDTVPVFELDAGYTFAKIGDTHVELLGVLQGAPFEDATVGIARVSLGLVR